MKIKQIRPKMCLKCYIAHYEILWHRVMLCNEFSALEYLIQRYALVNVIEKTESSVTLLHLMF